MNLDFILKHTKSENLHTFIIHRKKDIGIIDVSPCILICNYMIRHSNLWAFPFQRTWHAIRLKIEMNTCEPNCNFTS